MFKKLVQRNRTTFAYLGIVILTLISALGISTTLFIRERDARNSEAQLLKEADARAKIAQAALLLSRNDISGEDRLVDKIQLHTVEPSLEAANVLRCLGEWNVLQENRDKAAERFSKPVYANRVDQSDFTEQVTIDLLSAAPALVVAGKLDEYRQFVQEILTHYADTQDAVAAEQIVKASLLISMETEVLNQLAPLVKQLKDSMTPTPEGVDIYRYGWRNFPSVCSNIAVANMPRRSLQPAAFQPQNPKPHPDWR